MSCDMQQRQDADGEVIPLLYFPNRYINKKSQATDAEWTTPTSQKIILTQQFVANMTTA